MTDTEVGRLWDENAPVWTRLARAGYDVDRDWINTPAFLAMLPDVAGLEGLDLGCGEGHNTRRVAARGARMTAVDISPRFAALARQAEAPEPHGIRYLAASAQALPFPAGTFDFAMATMSLMDVPQPAAALREAHRVVRPGGFLQFSILHPCFNTPYRRLVRNAEGNPRCVEVADYFASVERVDEWLFSAAPPEAKQGLRPFRVPYFHRTLSWWLNAIIEAGFTLERVEEPYADEETARRCPAVADTRVTAYFLHLRCRR